MSKGFAGLLGIFCLLVVLLTFSIYKVVSRVTDPRFIARAKVELEQQDSIYKATLDSLHKVKKP